ncbi:MAG: Mth938-like domain-containing protein [Rhodospirillales bacterium]
MRKAGIGVEWMNTGAACRTYNVLVLEDRDVAAALIAID